MPDEFQYDVFLSHSTKDKAVVRPLAERLRNYGLKVWFDEWVLKAGDSIPAKIEEGLEQSRVLVLCMSANAFGSDWAQLESGTFRFRDPLNKERRLIPLRLDDAPIKGSLAQFLYINWLPTNQEYLKLCASCRLSAKPEPTGTKAFATETAFDVAVVGIQSASSSNFLVHAFMSFLNLLIQPAGFLARKADGHQKDVLHAFSFFILATLIGNVLLMITVPPHGHSFLGDIFGGIFVSLIITLFLSFPLWVAWWLVGTRNHVCRILTIVQYQAGVAVLSFGWIVAIVLLSVELDRPGTVKQIIDAGRRGSNHWPALIKKLSEEKTGLSEAFGLGLALTFLALLLFWLLKSWRGYRQAFNVGRLRSTIALLLFALLVSTLVVLFAWLKS